MTEKNTQIAISVNHVSKNFAIPHSRKHTVKSHFTGIFEKKSSTKKTKGRPALKDISFDIKEGEFFGIVGRNGSGKSTLLKMIAGIYQPTKGKIDVRGKLVPFIELGVGFNPELTGRENVYLNGAILGFSKKEIDDRYEKIVDFAELADFMEEKLKNYSSGMQVRLAFSCATMAQADILLVDEVLAVGDADFQRKCFNYFKQLKHDKKTVVFVSHDMNAVREYCDRAVLIEGGEVLHSGTSEEVSDEYTKLFVEEISKPTNQEKSGKRYGNQKITISKIELEHKVYKINDGHKEIPLNVIIKANESELDHVTVGFLVKNSSGVSVIGTNTSIESKKIKSLLKNKQAKISWKIPNIFGDGTYYLDIAITSVDGTTKFDWWEECVSFKVYKEKSSPYIVSPSVPTEIDYL